LAPEDRRRAIIQAVLPLLVEHGASVTTKQMAEAAGIAEGTIFRVFPDKHALIHEAVRFTVDPAPIQRGLEEIDPDAPIEIQLAEAAQLVLEKLEGVMTLMAALRTAPALPEGRPMGTPPFVIEANAAINKALAGLFERHLDRLRIEPARAAAAFRGLIFAGGHPLLSRTERLTVDEMVGVLLEGVVVPELDGCS
jgi:AcrR family transcriptional regulator